MLTFSAAGMATKTIYPLLDMNIAYYDVYGDGPDSAAFSRLGIPGPLLVGSSLAAGEWTVTADAFNSEDILIGDGNVVVLITGGQTTQAEVPIDPLQGTGSLAVSISWLEGTVASPVVSGTLAAAGGDPQSLSFTPGEDSASASLSALEVGYYTLILQLHDGEDVVWGQIEAVRILKDQLTEAVYELVWQDDG